MEITRLRQATKEDIGQIASLHVLSWRDAYRSILDPAFLAGPVESDRMAVWAARLSNPRNDQHVVVAVEQGVLVGFVCVFGDEDPKWGARIDNLHVIPSARGRGIGVMLLKSAASWVADRYPGSALHLWVFEMNALACQFYARLGGSVVEKSVTKIASAGGASILRFYWASATELQRSSAVRVADGR